MQMNDLKGLKFGRLTVLEKAESQKTPNGTVRTMWKCQCDCGNIVYRSQQNLRNVKHPSCGCWKNELTSERRLEDLTGQRFGRLTVIERAETTNVSTRWKCICDCGNECTVIAQNLKRGHTISCGCYREEVRPLQQFKHGYRHTRIYNIYGKIKDRCYNRNNPNYSRYGGRGITMCDEWLNDPKAFCEWAYAHGYKEDASYGECTIDRRDNNKEYSPENCRIATEKVQANNRRSNLLIEHNGETKTLAEWRDFFGMTQSKAHYHLVEKGRSFQYLIDNGIV